MKTKEEEGEKAAEQKPGSRKGSSGSQVCVIGLLSSAAEPSLSSLTVLLAMFRHSFH